MITWLRRSERAQPQANSSEISHGTRSVLESSEQGVDDALFVVIGHSSSETIVTAAGGLTDSQKRKPR